MTNYSIMCLHFTKMQYPSCKYLLKIISAGNLAFLHLERALKQVFDNDFSPFPPKWWFFFFFSFLMFVE